MFNRLTGLQQKVGNFPGVTVDKKSASLQLPSGREIQLLDLPGLYSLYPHAPDQQVSLEVLLQPDDPAFPEGILYIASATNLERHLLLLTQIGDLGIPVILCVNQMDLARDSGITVDIPALGKALGLPVFQINGRSGEGLDQVLQYLDSHALPNAPLFWDAAKALPGLQKAISPVFPEARYTAYSRWLLAHHAGSLSFLVEGQQLAVRQALEPLGFKPLDAQVRETLARFDRITPIVKRCVRESGRESNSFSDRVDAVLTHPVAGTAVFFGVLLLIFQAMFRWADWPMVWMDQGMTWTREVLARQLPDTLFSDMITDGLLPGIGGILIFIPQIAILFFLVSLMEESGYMARAVYLSDNLMRRFGLNGRSFVALISGVACAVPAVMTARGITNRQERLATIFVTPFMSCSARLPVFALLIAFAVPSGAWLGGLLQLQGLVLFALYCTGATAALVSARILRYLFPAPTPSYLMLELPPYQRPHWRNIALTVWQKVKLFVFNAGKIILVISLLLWMLSSFGPAGKMAAAEAQARESFEQEQGEPEWLDHAIAARRLEASWAGHLGRWIEPAIEPLGFDWKIGIALITSFAAREVFVSTMATIYGAGEEDNKSSILESMRQDRDPETGRPVFTAATAVSLLLFYVFAMQCMSTLVIVQRETGSWVFPFLQLVYMTGLAYLVSLGIFQLLSRIWG